MAVQILIFSSVSRLITRQHTMWKIKVCHLVVHFSEQGRRITAWEKWQSFCLGLEVSLLVATFESEMNFRWATYHSCSEHDWIWSFWKFISDSKVATIRDTSRPKQNDCHFSQAVIRHPCSEKCTTKWHTLIFHIVCCLVINLLTVLNIRIWTAICFQIEIIHP